jgi:hypothetical protein
VPRGDALGGDAVEPHEDDAEDERADDGEQNADRGTDELVEGGGRDEIDRGQGEGTQSGAEGRRHHQNYPRMVS